jgi:hypothetical protein
LVPLYPGSPKAQASLVTHGSGLMRIPGQPGCHCLGLTSTQHWNSSIPRYLPGQTPSDHCHADLTASLVHPPLIPLLLFSTSLGLPPSLSVIPAVLQAMPHWPMM